MADAPWTRIAPELELFWRSDAVQKEYERREQRFKQDEKMSLDEIHFHRGWIHCFEWLRGLATARAANEGRIAQEYRDPGDEEDVGRVSATRSVRSSYPV